LRYTNSFIIIIIIIIIICEETTAKRITIDPYYQRQNCSQYRLCIFSD